MKRKKLYSMLALGMAMTLIVGVPVSAAEVGGASSITTSDFSNEVTDTATVPSEVAQDVVEGKDAQGNVVKVEIVSSADATSAIEDKLADGKEITDGSIKTEKKTSKNNQPSLDGIATKDDLDKLTNASKSQFAGIKASEILVGGVSGKQVTILPVKEDVQNVALDAAKEIGQELGVTVGEDGLLASMDITIPLGANESAKITIPLQGDAKPDTSQFDYFVLHYDEVNGVWETLPAQITTDGIVIATFSSTSPVFIVRAAKATPIDNNKGDKNDNDDGDDNDSSDDDNSSADNTKASTTPAAVPANPAATPANPAVSPKTGE